MSDVAVFKMDTVIKDDIQDLQFFLYEELNAVKADLQQISKYNVNIVNFMSADKQLSEYSLVILANYILWFNVEEKRYDVLEVDPIEQQLYAYNLQTNDESILSMLDDTMDHIMDCLNFAESNGQLRNSESTVSLNVFLFEFFTRYPALEAIEQSSIDEIIEWFNGSRKQQLH